VIRTQNPNQNRHRISAIAGKEKMKMTSMSPIKLPVEPP
jgi:hypothetical protein